MQLEGRNHILLINLSLGFPHRLPRLLSVRLSRSYAAPQQTSGPIRAPVIKPISPCSISRPLASDGRSPNPRPQVLSSRRSRRRSRGLVSAGSTRGWCGKIFTSIQHHGFPNWVVVCTGGGRIEVAVFVLPLSPTVAWRIRRGRVGDKSQREGSQCHTSLSCTSVERKKGKVFEPTFA